MNWYIKITCLVIMTCALCSRYSAAAVVTENDVAAAYERAVTLIDDFITDPTALDPKIAPLEQALTAATDTTLKYYQLLKTDEKQKLADDFSQKSQAQRGTSPKTLLMQALLLARYNILANAPEKVYKKLHTDIQHVVAELMKKKPLATFNKAQRSAKQLVDAISGLTPQEFVNTSEQLERRFKEAAEAAAAYCKTVDKQKKIDFEKKLLVMYEKQSAATPRGILYRTLLWGEINMVKPLKKLIDFEPAINQALKLIKQNKKTKKMGLPSTEKKMEASGQLEKFTNALYEISRTRS